MITAQEAKEETQAAKEEEERQRKRAERYEYAQKISSASEQIEQNNFARAQELLADCPRDLRNWEWHYLDRLSNRLQLTIRMPEPIQELAISPDGQLIAILTTEGELKICNAETGEEALKTKSNGDFTSVAFSHDGNNLGTGDQHGNVALWNLKPTVPELLQATNISDTISEPLPSDEVQSLSFSPQADLLTDNFVAWGVADKVIVVNLSKHQDKYFILEGHTGEVTDLSFNKNADRLASGSEGNAIRVWSLATGRPVDYFSIKNPGRGGIP